MIDTLFIVLRKKPLTFLHYFHHVSTAAVTTYFYSEGMGVSRYFILLNSLVHSVMYSYYAFAMVGLKPSKQIAMAITTMQTSQMVIGFFATFAAYVLFTRDPVSCHGDKFTLTIGVVMYFVFFVLFCSYFFRTYLLKSVNCASKYRVDVNCNVQVKKQL